MIITIAMIVLFFGVEVLKEHEPDRKARVSCRDSDHLL